MVKFNAGYKLVFRMFRDINEPRNTNIVIIILNFKYTCIYGLSS